MKKLLLLLIVVLASVGVNAAMPAPPQEGNFSFNNGALTGSKNDPNEWDASAHLVQTLTVNTPGALAEWVASVANADGSPKDSGNAFQGIAKPFGGKHANRVRDLVITGTLNADDLEALSSLKCAGFGFFQNVDLSGVTLSEAEKADVLKINFSPASYDSTEGPADGPEYGTKTGAGAQYIRLPNDVEDLTAADMAALKTTNTAMKAAFAASDLGTSVPKVNVYSVEANSMPGLYNAFNSTTDLTNAKDVSMAGQYGERDLTNGAFNGNLFKNQPALWDFTGAHFADCTISAGQGVSYYAIDNQFPESESEKVSVSFQNYATNAFYYFLNYAPQVVDLKLPDNNMTELAPFCLNQMGSSNKANYMLVNDMTEAEFNDTFGQETGQTQKKYYNAETGEEYTGEKVQIDGQWKGIETTDCQVDLSTPSSESVYTDTWADNKTYSADGMTVNNGQVTPASFVARLRITSASYTFNGHTLQQWEVEQRFERRADGKLYLKDGVGNQYDNPYGLPVNSDGTLDNSSIYVEENVTYVVNNNNATFTPTSDRPAYQESGNYYGVIDNPGGVSFQVTTNYTYTYNDCDGNPQTLVTTDGNLTTYTAHSNSYFDLEEREVPVMGVATCAPIEELVIPNCYVKLDYECGKWAQIKKLVVGSGVKTVEGGAFLKCDPLEELDFVAGISDCYLGDHSFGECKSMKHIALSEGIVSLGVGCFSNSQNLESIRLPESLEYMGNDCLNNCLALNSITIPSNVKQIGQRAFTLCPFTDVYLTTTDPDKVPLVWSCGTNFGNYDGNCTFNHGHLDGWEGLPESYQDKVFIQQFDWDHAVEWYYLHGNGIPVLHYPQELYNKVRARISTTYHAKSTDGYGLPMQQDFNKRSNVNGADLGTSGAGKYTSDGWAQFMLMKDYIPEGESIVYSKDYDDVWYTMCFPFDLTDEQLEAAFNKGYNIVDFSAVEIIEADQSPEKKKTLILHFNTVAETFYKDMNGSIYERKRDGNGNVIRERHGNFDYNVYLKDGVEYHHCHANAKLEGNKTKTFAPGSSLAESNTADAKAQAIIIDGILATAGHPYMIHPAIGVAFGSPKQRCHFSGITWIDEDKRESTYNSEVRTIDLGVEKKNNNFNQEQYNGYGGQEYTFKGNWKEYKDGWQNNSEIGPEPTFDMEMPELRERPTSEPIRPNFPDPGQEPQPTTYNPVEDLTTYPVAFQNLYNKQFDEYFTIRIDGVDERFGPGQVWYDATYSDVIKLADYNMALGIQKMKVTLTNYFGHEPDADEYNTLKAKIQAFSDAYDLYFSYFQVYNDWKAWRDYDQAVYDYNNWDAAAVEAEYNTAMGEYQTAYMTYQVNHAVWLQSMQNYQILIPKYSYFLGRKTGEYPKYYREMAEEDASARTGGRWTQYTAIISPNTAAISGIEAQLDGKTASSNGFNLVIDEDYIADEFYTPTQIEKIVEEAEEKGQKVEYMKVVYNINGQIVREGTSIEGLPKGVYIVNGKKYFVR